MDCLAELIAAFAKPHFDPLHVVWHQAKANAI
jgi:hypothetical protein